MYVSINPAFSISCTPRIMKLNCVRKYKPCFFYQLYTPDNDAKKRLRPVRIRKWRQRRENVVEIVALTKDQPREIGREIDAKGT